MKCLLLLLLALAFAAPAPVSAAPLSSGYVVTTCGTLPSPPGPYLAGLEGEPTIDVTGRNCITGSITTNNSSVSTTAAAVPGSATYIGGNKAGNLVGLTLDGSSNLNVNCAAGCTAGTASNATSGVATSATNGQTVSWLYGFNGATWDQLQVDASKFLKVNCATGCSAGTFNNNADGVATSATNGQAAAWLYGWNGASFDRLQVDGSKFLKVTVAAALPAGSNVIGHAIIDSGSTTAVTGSTSNASSGVATGSVSVPTVSYNYGFNGTTWDQLQVDASKFLKVSIAASAISNFSTNIAQIGGGSTNLIGDVNNATTVTNTLDVIPVGRYNATLPTLTDTRYNSLQVGLRGGLHADIYSADGTSGAFVSSSTSDATAMAGGLWTQTLPRLYNGTNTDVLREAVNGTNSTGLGILPSANLDQFDDVAPTSITENQFGNVRMSANRNQYETIRDAAGNERGVNVNASNQLSVSIDGSSATNISTNIAQMNGVTVTMGNGVSGTGVQRVTLASDSTGQVASLPTVATTGGVSTTYVVEPTASDNHANIKNGAGQVYWMSAFNNSATVNYMRLYNAGTGFNGCNSATNLVWEGHIPASTSDSGFIYNFGMPLSFATGISICVTGGYGQTNTTNATASAMSITVGYN